MKQVEHSHANPKRKYSILRWIVIIWAIPFGIALLFMVLGKLPRWLEGYVILALLGWGAYKLYKIIKKAITPEKSESLKIQEYVKEALHLQLNGNVTIHNPYSGVFISGGAGSGKSKSIIEPLISDCGRKEFTGVIYDFKFPELASYMATAYKNSPVKAYYINFSDLTRTNRMNPIAPELMRNDSFAREFAFTILANLNPSMIKKPDFWSDNSTALLASIFWYLKKRHSQYCTLPHAISMILQPDLEALLKTLSEEPKCADMIAPILTAFANKADNQLAGVIASLQVALSKINTEEVYYITSASDFSLDLNNPQSKGILCIGNDPVLAGTYSPVIGLMLTAISKILNQQGKEKSVFMLDEFPTVFVPNIEQLPATARSNKVATVLACQDIAQIVDKYGKEKADTILSNLGNQFYGRTTNPATAQRVSQMFGKADRLMMTTSDNYNQTLIFGDKRQGGGKSYSYQERDLVKVQDVATLSTGSFYTILSEGKKRQGLSSISVDPSFNKTPIMPFRNISELDLEENFNKIKRETGEILIK